MYIDFAINTTDINDAEAKNLSLEIIKYPINSITVPYYLLKTIKQSISISNKPIALSCFIDYPLGISDLKTRFFAVEQAGKNGINTIDISIPQT